MVGHGYEEKFNDVMKYVKVRLDGSGGRLAVRDKEDLKQIFERLDKNRQGGEKRMSEEFIDKLLNTRAADHLVGKTIGHFGRTGKLPANVARARERGTQTYIYEGGHATKIAYRNHGKLNTRFKDVRTGRFIKNRSVRG